MGDRANVKIVDGDSVVFLYTHYNGTDLPSVLQRALQRGQERWTDGQYLARIIFSEMTNGNTDGLTGYGISSVVRDGEDRIITIDIDNQTAQVQTDRPFPLKGYVAWKNPRWIISKHTCVCVYCKHVLNRD